MVEYVVCYDSDEVVSVIYVLIVCGVLVIGIVVVWGVVLVVCEV